MAASRDIKRRIKSINSTRQITKAMELVSTVKLRRASEATLTNRPYAKRLREILERVRAASQEGISHPLLESHEGDTTLLIAIASDRTLAGAYNSNVIKKVVKFTEEERAAGRKVEAITLGKKIHDTVQKLNIPVLQNYPLSGGLIQFEELHALYEYAIKSYSEGRFSKVRLVYTHFTSMMSQDVVDRDLLPLNVDPIEDTLAPSEFIFEPSADIVLEELIPYVIEIQLYQAALESTASEHSARRVAMKNATDNAKSMIDRLTLTYNSLRQGAITQEIAEITSGAAALE